MSKAKEHAFDALHHATFAVDLLHSAALALTKVGREVSRDLHRDDDRFIGAALEIDTAWDLVTSKVLDELAKARASIQLAKRAAHDAEQAAITQATQDQGGGK